MTVVDREFALERYKYILEQKKVLNEISFRVVGIYQAGLALVLAGFFQVASRIVAGDISREVGLGILDGMTVALVLLSAFALLMLLSGIAAWLGYRRDESDMEAQYLNGRRAMPRMLNVFKWYETYIVAAIVGSALVVAFYFHSVRLQIGV